MSELLIAFAGATIAFAFFLLGQTLATAYDRRKEYYDALVILERVLNLQLDQIHVIGRHIREMRGGIGQGQVGLGMPRPITEAQGMHLELLDIDLVNALFSATVRLKRVNNDIQNLREAYSRLAERYLDGTLPRDSYIENGTVVATAFEGLLVELVSYQDSALTTIARIRLLLAAKRPFSHRVIAWLATRHTKQLSDEQVLRERERLEAEILEVSQSKPIKSTSGYA